MSISRGSQIKLGAILSYGTIIFNILVGLIYTPWMVHSIGKSDYGLYTLVTSFLTYFVVDFGLWLAVNKILSQLRAEHKDEEEKIVIGITSRIYLSLDILICIGIIIVYFFIDDIFIKLTANELEKFKIIYIIAAFFSILSFPFGFIKGVYNAYELYIETKILDLICRISIITLTIIILLCGGGLYALVISYGLIPFLTNIARVIYLKKKGIGANFSIWDNNIAKQIFSISIWLFLVVLAELFINNIAPSLIATFSGSTEIAIFGIGLTIYNYVYLFSSSISGLFLPKVTELYVNNQAQVLEELSIRVGRLQLIITGYITMGVILTGQDFMLAWMGKDYIRSYFVMTLLIIPLTLTSIQQIESSCLLAANKIKYRAFLMIATAISSISLSIVLIPYFGAIGAAIGISCSNFCIMFIGMNIIYKRCLNISYKSLAVAFIPFLLAYLSITIIFKISCQFGDGFLPASYWVRFIIKALLFTILYIIALIPILNSYETEQIKKFITFIKHKKTPQ